MKQLTRDRLKTEILSMVKARKMYRDNGYNVRRLAEDLNTNVRYISIVLAECYGMNYSSFINKFRVDDAVAMLENEKYDDFSIEDICTAVGFMNRQSFFTYFTRFTGTTPQKFREKRRINGQSL